MDVYAFLRDPIVGTFGSLTPRDRGDEGLLLPWAEVGLCFRGLGDLSIFESLMASLASPSNSGGTGYTRIVSPYMGSLGLLVGRTDPSRRGEPGDRTGLVPREPGDRTRLVPREPGDRTRLVPREPGDRTGLVPREPGDRTGAAPREPGDRTGAAPRE